MLDPSDLREAVIALLRGIGAIIASAVYLSGVIAWGIAANSKPTLILAVTSAGLTYLGYLFQLLADYPKTARTCVISSILFGILAGLSALVLH